ncbi:uncharacterized protein LOC122499231 [Leptopilina heterotoma]|uniref:uncharacterized protein LOC122499231 n=1 Tax=Leptopilina heterotoma TaxID=63436 RepID=UPI001CA9F395|nr:uncharacterized protein LOC122499231 [Leptopilina heterotoma]
MNESVVAFLMMLLLGSGQTFLTLRSIRQVEFNLSKNQTSSNLAPKSAMSPSSPAKTTSTEYICIEVSPNLPPCNFNKFVNSMGEEESLTQIHAKRKREVDIPKSLIVYKIEGCIPSRLPFRLPFCKPEESRSPLAKIQNLRPFKTKEIFKTAPEVFPKVNHTHWLEQMKHIQLEHQIKSQLEVKHNLSHPLENAGENRIKQRQISNKILLEKNWFKTKDEESYKEKKRIFNMKKTIHKTQKRIEQDIQEARGLDQELDKLVAKLEFPYSRAIPFDPEKLQVARIGSEFPYSKAIPFDAEKLQVARERSVYPFWKQVLYRPENNHQLRDIDYSDDESSHENNFLYPKKSHHSRKLLSAPSTSRGDKLVSDNWEREEKTSVLQKEFNYHKPSKLGRKRENSKHHIRSSKDIKKFKEFRSTNTIPSKKNQEIDSSSFGEEKHPKPHYLSRKLKFIKEGSEFPYTKAIPFDAEKLAVAAARKSDLSKQAFHSKLSTNSKEYISRKPLAFNAGNNLSSLLFVPYNRRASIHHSKNQRGKSC